MASINHLIYEYKKKMRNLILCTAANEYIEDIEAKLIKNNIPYLIHRFSFSKVNIFFGEELCLRIVRQFSNLNLNKLTDEEDFMLGIMLGYGNLQQYERYLTRKQKKNINIESEFEEHELEEVI